MLKSVHMTNSHNKVNDLIFLFCFCTMCDFHNFGLIFVGQRPQRLNQHFLKFFRMECGVRIFFQKMLILVFEVIVQPPKTHFWTFSSETKIMKITHSAFAHEEPSRFGFWIWNSFTIHFMRYFRALWVQKARVHYYSICCYWLQGRMSARGVVNTSSWPR